MLLLLLSLAGPGLNFDGQGRAGPGRAGPKFRRVGPGGRKISARVGLYCELSAAQQKLQNCVLNPSKHSEKFVTVSVIIAFLCNCEPTTKTMPCFFQHTYRLYLCVLLDYLTYTDFNKL